MFVSLLGQPNINTTKPDPKPFILKLSPLQYNFLFAPYIYFLSELQIEVFLSKEVISTNKNICSQEKS